MRNLCGLACLGLAFLTMSATTVVPDRVARDRAEKDEFLHLNFLYEGLGMHLSPGLTSLEDLPDSALQSFKKIGGDHFIQRLWGLNTDDSTGKIIGLFPAHYKDVDLGAVGCVICHSGKAAGKFYVGIGNKNIDVGELGSDAYWVEKLIQASVPADHKSEAYLKVEDSALEFTKHLSDPKITNSTQGLVPTGIIRRWFYDIAGDPYPPHSPSGAVKVPALFGYGEKRKVGQFCDGGGDGNFPGWAIAVELVAGQDPRNVREYLPKIQHAEDVIADFLPPKYPFKIDMTRAERGEKLFNNTCARCHGTYENDADGLPIYKAPKLIPLDVVKTDDDRLKLVDEDFVAHVEKSPLADIIRETSSRNHYFAPRLHGIWARFPYLHNASVPSIRALLTVPSKRPVLFSLIDAGEKYRFDEKNLGLTTPSFSGQTSLINQAMLGDRSVYFTQRVGQSNQGHAFYTDLSDSDKTDIIEYLKTL